MADAKVIDARALFARRRVKAAYAAGCPVCHKKFKSSLRLANHLYRHEDGVRLFNARAEVPNG